MIILREYLDKLLFFEVEFEELPDYLASKMLPDLLIPESHFNTK